MSRYIDSPNTVSTDLSDTLSATTMQINCQDLTLASL